ncbi:hypothetical protein B0H34DRAFT_818882 [Crassisporium funariophilum]|nr:hypothetical protein B0H34DRAFT_818882 [Crassisporium funariophilum]
MVNSQHQQGDGPRPTSRQIHEEKHKKAALCLLGAILGVISVLGHVEAHMNKRPMHTSTQTGQKWLDELLVELEQRAGLRPTQHVLSEEQLAIFLHIARTGLSNAEMQEQFQRSGETVSKCFHRILNMLVLKEFYGVYVCLPANEVPPEI